MLELPVIGQDEQALTVTVQAPRRIDAAGQVKTSQRGMISRRGELRHHAVRFPEKDHLAGHRPLI